MQTFFYFAYGSNLLSHRLLARCPSARVISIATTDDWTVKFTKPGGDGSGKAGLVEQRRRTPPRRRLRDCVSP
jgi:gamma-glutamylcyclotransferase